MVEATAVERRRPTRRRTRLAAVAAATTAAAATWLVAVPLLGVEPTVDSWDGGAMSVTTGHVVVVALAASLAGWAALAVGAVLIRTLTRSAR